METGRLTEKQSFFYGPYSPRATLGYAIKCRIQGYLLELATFSYGEPTTREGLADEIRYARKEHGHKVVRREVRRFYETD